MVRRKFGRREEVQIFYDEDIEMRDSEYRTASGDSIGRALWINGVKAVGTVLAEYVGNKERPALWIPNSYTVELVNRVNHVGQKTMLNCLPFSLDASCIASMANDPVGLTHATTGAKAVQNCMIVSFIEYPDRAFIVARLLLEDEEGFVDYGDMYGARCSAL
jgi:hypothetical protein